MMFQTPPEGQICSIQPVYIHFIEWGWFYFPFVNIKDCSKS